MTKMLHKTQKTHPFSSDCTMSEPSFVPQNMHYKGHSRVTNYNEKCAIFYALCPTFLRARWWTIVAYYHRCHLRLWPSLIQVMAWRQTWTIYDILSIEPLETNCSEILIIQGNTLEKAPGKRFGLLYLPRCNKCHCFFYPSIVFCSE